MSYIDGFVVPVPASDKAAYTALAGKAALVFKEYGATRVVECWGDDVPVGQHTDFMKSCRRERRRRPCVLLVEWPSKAVRDEASARSWPTLACSLTETCRLTANG